MFKRIILVLFLLTTVSQTIYADDVTDSIDEALEAYKEGEYSEAIESLNYATQVIQQKKAGQLSAFLPEPLEGWSVNSRKGSGGAIFGGGSSSSRSYKKGSSSVTVAIAADSPAMQSMMMIFANPMFANSSGGEMQKIKRQKAVVTYDEGRKQGDIKIIVKKRFFVTIEGRHVSRDDLVAYAKGINYKKLSRLP
ncbi:MAG: hypothetical protein B5M52_07280 [Helicobacteraceae bacterium 4484_230]|nr:MAG: hypothetical protein B5M52_07280 [Helicobacteraceae bacterium 4484_230]